MIDGWGISCEIALIWMLLYVADDQQAITWANVKPDICHHMVWLAQNGLIRIKTEVSNYNDSL